MDTNTLLKFMGQVGEFPTLDLGPEAERSERLLQWRVAVSTQLKATPPLVREWWSWAWDTAERHYQQWVVLDRTGRNQYYLQLGRLPDLFEIVNGWAYTRVLEKLPVAVKQWAQQREAD